MIRLFSVGAVCIRRVKGKFECRQALGVCLAEDGKTASSYISSKLLRDFPLKDGWVEHECNAVEAPADYVQEAFLALPMERKVPC